ncbi:MAG TPA: hypothetical protein VMY59_00920 [Candidatus Thermoplasmatota archaeon]|nr:hypothetical protein [Candidatus Thermoplasmatota archaeon]
MKRKWFAVGIILLFVGTRIIPSTAEHIIKNQYITTEEIQIRIEGGIRYRVSVSNPYNTSFNATFNITTLFITHRLMVDGKWLISPLFETVIFGVPVGFGFISIKVVALDKTATRNGVVIGVFVIFGPYK